MKILLVGAESDWAIERFYLKYLRKLVEVDFYNIHGEFLNYYHSSVINKLCYRSGLSRIEKRLNSELINKCKENHYDAILVFKGMEVRKKTLLELKSKGIYLLNYNPDHPFIYFGRGSGNKNVLKSINVYNHHYSYSKKIIVELKNQFGVNASWLPFAYEIRDLPQIENEIKAVCFIGNADKDRAATIQKIINNKINVEVFGNGWGDFLKDDPYLKMHKAVYGDEFTRTAQRYRIQLNLFRPHNEESHNMRSFEMPSVGCIMLAPESEEHQFFFEANYEAFYFNKINLIEKVRHILNLEDAKAYKIRENAFRRCVSSNYHYRDRAKQLFEDLSGKVNSYN